MKELPERGRSQINTACRMRREVFTRINSAALPSEIRSVIMILRTRSDLSQSGHQADSNSKLASRTKAEIFLEVRNVHRFQLHTDGAHANIL